MGKLSWVEVLEQKSDLEKELKRRAMLFDCEGKERMAAHLKLPYDFFHLWSFDNWTELKRLFGEFTEEAEREYVPFLEFHGRERRRDMIGAVWRWYAKQGPDSLKRVYEMVERVYDEMNPAPGDGEPEALPEL